MKNLLEQLRPEVMEAMELDRKLYPHFIAKLETDLKENHSWLYLTVNTASALCGYDKSNLGIIEVKNLFIENTEK